MAILEQLFPVVKAPPNRFGPPKRNNPPTRTRAWGLDVAVGTPRTCRPLPPRTTGLPVAVVARRAQGPEVGRVIGAAQGAGGDVIDVERDPRHATQRAPWEPLPNLTGQLGPGVAVARPATMVGERVDLAS
jgi:hypothetical protein